MNFETFADLIGHSVLHPDVKSVLQETDHDGTVVPEKGKNGFLIFRDAESKELGFTIELWTRLSCGEDIKSSFTGDKFELVVRAVNFHHLIEGQTYPFSFSDNDDTKSVPKKLEQKPWRKHKSAGGYPVHWYYKDNFLVAASFDPGNKLLGFSIKQQDVMEKKNAKLKAAAGVQQKNITTEHLEKLKSLAAKLPTADWLQRMNEENEEGESPFTPENIRAAEAVLKDFLTELAIAAQKNKASAVEAVIKKTVKKFNRLNDKNDFIETLEREDLVEFITAAVRLTGYQIEEGADITADWREEW
jgi:hypothetical protein